MPTEQTTYLALYRPRELTLQLGEGFARDFILGCGIENFVDRVDQFLQLRRFFLQTRQVAALLFELRVERADDRLALVAVAREGAFLLGQQLAIFLEVQFRLPNQVFGGDDLLDAVADLIDQFDAGIGKILVVDEVTL